MSLKMKNRRPKVRKHGPAAVPIKRITIEIPAALLERTDQAAAELTISRSQVIQCTLERFLEVLDNTRLEQELAAGYQANAALDRQICEEFAYVDAESP